MVEGFLIDAAADEAVRLHRELGMAPDQAARLAARGMIRAAGLGQEEPGTLQTIRSVADAGPLKQIRDAVSPWLWVTSVVGFGLAILNTRRIAKMYRGWRSK